MILTSGWNSNHASGSLQVNLSMSTLTPSTTSLFVNATTAFHYNLSRVKVGRDVTFFTLQDEERNNFLVREILNISRGNLQSLDNEAVFKNQ